MTIAEALRNSSLFSKLDDQEIANISGRCTLRHLAGNHELLTQHQYATSVYILKIGALRIFANNELIAVVRTVQVFGEMSCVLDNTPASATVVTDGDCEVIEINKADFLNLLEEVPRIWRSLFYQTTSRLAKGNLRLSEVLTNSPEGFLKLDNKAHITDEYTTKCELYLGTTSLGGKSFPELVYAQDPQQIKSWLEIYSLFFEDSILGFEDICFLLTANARMGTEDNPIDLLFSYHPSKDIDGRCIGIYIGVKDVTVQRQLEREQALIKEKEAILARVHANPESFFALQSYMVQTIQDLKAHVLDLQTAAPNAAPFTPEELARKLHSLKGFAGMYALEQMHDALDHMEMELRYFKQESLPKCLKALASLEESATHVMQITDSLDPSLKKRLLGIVITIEEFDALFHCLQQKDCAKAERILTSARSMEASQLFSAWLVTAQRLSNQVEKDVQFVLDGDDALLPLDTFNELGRVLPQLLRNAIEHGIELPGFREMIGKPRVGIIKAQLSKMDNRLKITISDDGAGINFSKLAEVALAHRTITPELAQQFTQSGELWRILLIPGFSTAQIDLEQKSLSGHGMGMNAVSETITKLGGSVVVASELSRGTQVSIEIPFANRFSHH